MFSTQVKHASVLLTYSKARVKQSSMTFGAKSTVRYTLTNAVHVQRDMWESVHQAVCVTAGIVFRIGLSRFTLHLIRPRFYRRYN